MSYETIDHDADIGIRFTAATIEELFIDAARAMFDLMVQPKRDFVPAIKVPISLEAQGREELLVKWLQELLFVYETRRLVLTHFWMDEMSETHLAGGAKGLKFDRTRHTPNVTIKAVTYHKLRIDEGGGKFSAQVIFDI